jgi:hypothetical protein
MAFLVRFKSAAISFVLCILLFLVAVPGAFAQFNSGFTGVVVEQSGGAVPNAKVTVTNQATHVSQFSISTESGSFRIPSLPGGVYTIEVEATGFKTWTQSDVQLESNQVKTIYPSLVLPTQSTSIEVTGTVAAVETDRSDTTRELSETTIDAAPLLGRNIYTSMIQLAPGITGSGLPSGGALGSGSANNDSFEQEAGYQINAVGQRQENNEYDVDGSGVNSASRDGVVNLSPEPDFIQSVRISGATFDAAKGRYSGAYVQVFTKPGTNSFHGTLSEYFTNNTLTSRTIFQNCPPGETGCRAIPAFRRNEFGGTFGGPIVKNKLFFFIGAFGLLSSNATTEVASVETPQFAQFVEQNFPNSIASTFFKQAPPGANPTKDILTVAQVQALNPGFFPSSAFPADLPAVGTAFLSESPTHNAYQYHVRVDYNINESKDRLFFDLFRTYSDQVQLDPRPIYRVVVPNTGFYGKLDWTHAFSPTLLNEAGFTVVRAVGSNPGTSSNKDLPNAYIAGVSQFSQWGSAGWVHENFNWHDVLTWSHGNHTISTGVDIDRHHDDDNFTNADLRPGFSFNNIMDFAQDQPVWQGGPALTVADGALASNLYNVLRWVYYGAFVQDDWKVTHRLTVNLGLRYDYFGHWGNNHNSTTPMPFFTPGAGSDFAAQVASGVMSVRGGNSAYVTDNTPMGFGPRIGFGWDVFGNGKMAVRGGYGLFYNNVADGSWSFPSRANPPVWVNPSFSVWNASHPFSYGLGNSAGTVWPVPAISFQANPAGGIVGINTLTSGVQSHVDQPRTHVWMLAIQKDLGHNLVAEADYNGSHSNNLFIQTDVNRFPGDLIINKGVQTRLNPNFGPIIFGRTIGIADGNYGTFMLTKRMSQSWQVRGIFTFGKATDDMSSNDNGTAGGEAIFNPLNISSQHGLADFNVSKRFTVDSLWNLPSPFKEGVGKTLLGGWRMSGILVLQSGLPFTVYTSASFNPIFDTSGNVIGLLPGSGDFNADGYGYDTPNRPAAGAVSTGSRSDFIKGFASKSAFPTPALGSTGNLGRNTYIGPGLANVNMQFTKAFTFERYGLEFRADIFNLFNRVNLTQPVSDLSSGQFGQSTSQNLPRSAQFGLHFSF